MDNPDNSSEPSRRPDAARTSLVLQKPSRLRLSPWVHMGVVLFAALLGTSSGFYFTREPGFALIGGLLGLLVGGVGGLRLRGGVKGASRFPNAHLCFVLSAGAWLLAISIWAWVFSAGFLRGEGASSLFIVIVLPLTLVCWLVGGPMASLVGRNAMQQIQAGTRPEGDHWMARTGSVLSRAMTFALCGLLLWILSSILR
jgi:hypothetical protein